MAGSVVEILRVQVAGRPLLLAVLLALAAAALLRGRAATRAATLTAIAGGLAALAAYAGIAALYAVDPRYFDPAEPTIPIVGWLFTLGEPIYHGVDADARYAHIYGPLAFILPGLVLQALGPGIVVSKLLGVAGGLGSLALTYASLRTAAGRGRALVLTGACALVCLAFRNYTFWTRPDPLLLLASAAGLLIVVRTGGTTAGVGLGVTAGILAGLKFTGPLYVLPLFVLLAFRDGRAPVLAALAAGSVTASLPFALSNVSLPAYLTWIDLSAGNGLRAAGLRQNLDWTAFLLLPLAAAWLAAEARARLDRRLQLSAVALLGAMIAVAMAASKPGAGPYHLLPFAPAIAYGVAVGLGGRREAEGHRLTAPALLAWTVTAALAAGVQQASFFDTLADGHAAEEVRALRAFLDRNPGIVAQMADSPYDRPTFVRPLLTFASGVYLIDSPAVQEHQLSGVPIPPATLQAIATCRVDAWLVPADTMPFTGRNRYPQMALAPLFPDGFRETFHDAYERAERIGYYDVWRCRARSPRPPG